ncbi:N-acetyltransferase esco2 [Podochytrium sp. JEL0797]|nr:N-acetyltransferase esco2 [Podochytrium sp. JEL0797]
MPRGLVQTVLDLGQKNAGMTVCKECGMRFANAAKEDDVLHLKYHASVLGGIDYKGYAHDVIAEEFLTESGRVKLIVVAITSTMSVAQKRKVAEIVAIVNQELGAVAVSQESLDLCKLILYVAKGKVVGCVLAEPIEQAFRLNVADRELEDENSEMVTR